jgi:hypothetical protein
LRRRERLIEQNLRMILTSQASRARNCAAARFFSSRNHLKNINKMLSLDRTCSVDRIGSPKTRLLLPPKWLPGRRRCQALTNARSAPPYFSFAGMNGLKRCFPC